MFIEKQKAVYCSYCNLKLGEQEKNIVVEGQKFYHSSCHDIKRKRERTKDSDPSDITVFIGLFIVVIGYFFA